MAETASFDAGPAAQANGNVVSYRRPAFFPRQSRGPRASRLLVAAACALALAPPAGGAYAIRGVIADGGNSLRGGSFQLEGSFGQAPTDVSAGAGLRLYSGFWAPDPDSIFGNDFD